MDWNIILQGLGDALQTGGQAYGRYRAQRQDMQYDRAREDRARKEREDARRAENEQQNQERISRGIERSGDRVQDAQLGTLAEMAKQADRERRGKATTALIRSMPEGEKLMAQLSSLGADPADVNPSLLDNVWRANAPPKVEKSRPLYSETGTDDWDENLRRLAQLAQQKQRFPSAAATGADERADRAAKEREIAAARTGVRTAQTDYNAMLARRPRQSQYVDPSTGFADTTAFQSATGDWRADSTAKGDAKPEAMAILQELLQSRDQSAGAPAMPVRPAPPQGPSGVATMPTRGQAKPLGARDKERANADPEFRAFLMSKGYSVADLR